MRPQQQQIMCSFAQSCSLQKTLQSASLGWRRSPDDPVTKIVDIKCVGEVIGMGPADDTNVRNLREPPHTFQLWFCIKLSQPTCFGGLVIPCTFISRSRTELCISQLVRSFAKLLSDIIWEVGLKGGHCLVNKVGFPKDEGKCLLMSVVHCCFAIVRQICSTTSLRLISSIQGLLLLLTWSRRHYPVSYRRLSLPHNFLFNHDRCRFGGDSIVVWIFVKSHTVVV